MYSIQLLCILPPHVILDIENAYLMIIGFRFLFLLPLIVL
jgi:hypothetical protein